MIQVLLPPPLQADLECSYHRLSKLNQVLLPPPLQAENKYSYHRFFRLFLRTHITTMASPSCLPHTSVEPCLLPSPRCNLRYPWCSLDKFLPLPPWWAPI